VPVTSEMRSIDYNSPLPFYHQLADILREEIDKGTWGVGMLIPAEGALTEMFGISRSVTRKTLDILEGEGRVIRIKGKGTLVTQPKTSYQAAEAAGTWFAQRTGELRLGQVISANRVPVGGNVGRLLGMSPREEVWEIVLTHTLNRSSVSMSHLYLRISGTLSTGAPPEFEAGGPDYVRQLASRYGHELISAEVEIEMVGAEEREARVLGVDTGLMLVQVSSIESSKRQVGFVRTVIRPDTFFLKVSLERSPQTVTAEGLSGMVSISS
jgi:GntR family transcriptional regulator